MTDTTNSADTTPPTVPAGDSEVGAAPPATAWEPRTVSRRRAIPRRVGYVVVSVIAVAAVASSFIPLPFYRISPGSVYDTIGRVEVLGETAFPPDGEIGFVTVSQTANISIWQWVDAKLDRTLEIKHEDEVNGTQTADEKRAQDRRRMQLSKNSAVVVALERLGFDLIVTPLGVEVSAVFDCTGADGLLGTGDLIVGLDDAEILDMDDLVGELAGREIGDTIELLVGRLDPDDIARTSETETVELTLGSANDPCLDDDVRSDEERAFIGIGTSPYTREDLPFEVNIDTGSVGGPSAGLAFTLAILDVLTDGEMTNGVNVVATGTISRDGNVGPVGGVRHKVVAAERADGDLFLVPVCCDNWADTVTGEPLDLPTNYEEALEYRDDITVVGVATLDDALRAIGAAGGDVSEFFPEDLSGEAEG